MYPILSCTGDRIFRCCVHAFGMFFCSLYGSRPNAVLCGNALTISHVAVADIQINSKLLLCHFSIFPKCLNTFTRCSRIIIHHSFRFFRREWAELHPPCRIRPAHDFSPT